MATDNAPAQPTTILRGHKAQVHAAAFVRNNERLLTGDADGFVVAWDLTIMRPRAVWQAHTSALLGISGWQTNRVITHGRDHKLIVWKLAEEDEASMSTVLPLDASPEPRRQPWILHMLEVNTMNFCTFSACPIPPEGQSTQPELLVAVPDTLASEAIDIFHLPSQNRVDTVKLSGKNGMVMALSLFSQAAGLVLVVGYENGAAFVATSNENGSWTTRYRAQTHKQPILSLDVAPCKSYFLTSSADAVIAKHPIPTVARPVDGAATKSKPVYNNVRQGGSDVDVDATSSVQKGNPKPRSLLSESLGSAKAASPLHPPATEIEPIKVFNTKHAGQQDLKIRSDGRIFATAGWDSRVRVYSTKTLKELAVLKWHQVGCYAVGFSVLEPTASGTSENALATEGGEGGGTGTLVPRLLELTVKERRIQQAGTAHWLAAGSKDGKVSLWNVF